MEVMALKKSEKKPPEDVRPIGSNFFPIVSANKQAEVKEE